MNIVTYTEQEDSKDKTDTHLNTYMSKIDSQNQDSSNICPLA